NRHRPARHGWFCFRNFAAMVNRSCVWSTSSINTHDIIAQQINIPNYERTGGEVICSFLRHFALGAGSIIAFAANLSGKYGRAFVKLHARVDSNMESSVWTERFTMRKIHHKRFVVANSTSKTRALAVFAK